MSHLEMTSATWRSAILSRMADRNLSLAEDMFGRVLAGNRKMNPLASRVYIGTNDLYLSCPAVSQQEIGFDRPTGGAIVHQLMPIVEESGDAGGFPLM